MNISKELYRTMYNAKGKWIFKCFLLFSSSTMVPDMDVRSFRSFSKKKKRFFLRNMGKRCVVRVSWNITVIIMIFAVAENTLQWDAVYYTLAKRCATHFILIYDIANINHIFDFRIRSFFPLFQFLCRFMMQINIWKWIHWIAWSHCTLKVFCTLFFLYFPNPNLQLIEHLSLWAVTLTNTLHIEENLFIHKQWAVESSRADKKVQKNVKSVKKKEVSSPSIHLICGWSNIKWLAGYDLNSQNILYLNWIGRTACTMYNTQRNVIKIFTHKIATNAATMLM